MNIARFIGLDYASHGRGPKEYDCWGLVMAVSETVFRRPLPDYAAAYQNSDDRPSVAFLMWQSAKDSRWRQVDEPAAGDLVQFRIGHFTCHAGILVGEDDFLHIMRGRGSALESMRSLAWKDRLIGVWRYE